MADEELRKAFQDLQFMTNENRARIAQGEQLKKSNIQKKRMSELTASTLASYPEDIKMYRSIGRMFLLTSKSAEIARHNVEAKEFQSKVEQIDKQKEYLERTMEEAERNLREMVQSRRQ